VVAVANELKNLIDKVNTAMRDERLKRIALTTVLAIQKPRIFEKGQDDKGAQVGTYGTNPISISKKNQARNTGKTYFKGGYDEYKSAIGKNPGYVNSRNTDQMMMDYGVIVNGSEAGLGFQNSFNADKAGWLQEKYKKDYFHLSNQEVEVIGNVYVQALNRAL